MYMYGKFAALLPNMIIQWIEVGQIWWTFILVDEVTAV